MIDNERCGLTPENSGERHTPVSRSWVRPVLVSCVVALWLSACGSSDESSAERAVQQVDEGVASAQDTYKGVLKASGLAQENADGKLVIDIKKDGERVRVGQDLPVPKWLPEDFPLPADLSIQLVAEDQGRENKLQGNSAAVTQSDLAERITDWSTAQSWELIMANTAQITTVSAGGDVIDVRIKDGVGMELVMSKRPVAFDRQKAAVEVVSPGIATVTLAGEIHTLKGECKIKGSSYGFEFYAPDGSATGIVNIQAADREPQGTASFHSNTSSGFNQYTISFPMDNNEGPVVTASGKAFSVSGKFGSMGSAGMQAVPGSFAVRCE